jgi:dTMP kinase
VSTVSESIAELVRGRFIVFDGPEGCGKSTQARLLLDRLIGEGLEIVLVRDPGTTRIGEQIRTILLNPDHDEMSMRCEMLLYMAARAQMMAQAILPALERGQVVVCDRFVSSTLAYQLGGDGLSEQEIRRVAEITIRGRWPDLTIILSMSAGRSIARVKRAKDRIEQRPLAYHEQVMRNYLAQAEADPAHYHVVDADRPIMQVHEEIWKALVKKLDSGR